MDKWEEELEKDIQKIYKNRTKRKIIISLAIIIMILLLCLCLFIVFLPVSLPSLFDFF